MDRWQRLELVVRLFVAHEQGDLSRYMAASGALYAAIGDDAAAAEAMRTTLTAYAATGRTKTWRKRIKVMSEAGLVTLVDWIGCDVETFGRTLGAVLDVERAPNAR